MARTTVALAALFGCAAALPALAEPLPEPATLRQWVSEMKLAARGPFSRIRWFCKDGTILPPEPYACVPHGGGSQHGEWNSRVLALRADGFLVANILADLDERAFAKRPDQTTALAQMLIEQFLIQADDGWILRRARFYRGALQEESERRGARRLLFALAEDPRWLGERFLLLRTAARFLAHGTETASLTEVRQLSSSLAGKDRAFERLRNKIHVRPDAGDAERVRAYAAKVSGDATEYSKLATLLERVYARGSAGETLRTLAKRAKGIPGLAEALANGVAALQEAKDAASRFVATAELMAVLREQVLAPDGPALRVGVLDASLALETEHFVAATALREHLPSASRRQQLQWLIASVDAGYGAGLLSQRQRAALRGALSALDSEAIGLGRYQATLRYLGLVPGWASRWLDYHFGAAVDKLALIEPLVHLFTQDHLRASPLFFYAPAIDGLLSDANRLAGVRNVLFDRDVGAGLRGLNPGLARGPLMLAPAEEHGEFRAEGIYLLPETTSDLPPVAGILTAGEGNPLSHVQLLARNLGIPNVGVDETLLPELRAKAGQTVVLAVSPGGAVRLGADDEEWRALFEAEAKVQAPEVLIRPDLDKLDLSRQDFIPLSRLRATDSGRIVGPKAAKLGELRHHYPEAVAEGLTIPFGIFKQRILDQAYGDTGQTVFEWMVEQYQALANMPAGSAERVAATDAFREQLYQWILNADTGESFRQALRVAMEEAFGEDGSYGVFVRSDTNVEDLPGFTGAGLNLTVPNVVGFEQVLAAIQRVWASPFTARAFAWRQALMDQPQHVYPAVLLMRSVPAEKSGVLVTQHIETGESGWLSVAVNEGVGGAVDGQAAESLRIDTRTGEVSLLAQATARIRRTVELTGGVAKVPTSGSDTVLAPPEIEALVDFAKELPSRFPNITDAEGRAAPADVEFGFLNGRLMLFQIRPFLESARARGSHYLRSLDGDMHSRGEVRVDLTETPESTS